MDFAGGFHQTFFPRANQLSEQRPGSPVWAGTDVGVAYHGNNMKIPTSPLIKKSGILTASLAVTATFLLSQVITTAPAYADHPPEESHDAALSEHWNAGSHDAFVSGHDETGSHDAAVSSHYDLGSHDAFVSSHDETGST